MFGTVRIANARDAILYDLASTGYAARGTFLATSNANDPATGSDVNRPHYTFQYLPLVSTDAASETNVQTHLFDGIMPGLVAMVRGLGHSAFDAFVSGKGVSVNALMSPMEDPGTGLEAAWGVRAKLVKA